MADQTFVLEGQASGTLHGTLTLNIVRQLTLEGQASGTLHGTLALNVVRQLVMAGQAQGTLQGTLVLDIVRQLVMAGQASETGQGTVTMGMAGQPTTFEAGDGVEVVGCPVGGTPHAMYTFRSIEGGIQVWCDLHHSVESILIGLGKSLAWAQRLNELAGCPHWGGI
jgi:hypothetical protein